MSDAQLKVGAGAAVRIKTTAAATTSSRVICPPPAQSVKRRLPRAASHTITLTLKPAVKAYQQSSRDESMTRPAKPFTQGTIKGPAKSSPRETQCPDSPAASLLRRGPVCCRDGDRKTHFAPPWAATNVPAKILGGAASSRRPAAELSRGRGFVSCTY